LHKSVSEIRNLDKEEILQWEAFDEYIEPIGGRRIDVATASINRTLYLMNTTEKDFAKEHSTLDFVEGHVNYKGLGVEVAGAEQSNPVTSLLLSNKKSKKNKEVMQDALGKLGLDTKTVSRQYTKEEIEAENQRIVDLLNRAIGHFDTEAEKVVE